MQADARGKIALERWLLCLSLFAVLFQGCVVSGNRPAMQRLEPAVVKVIAGNLMGSGVILGSAGYVLTGNHVINGSKSADVYFIGGAMVAGDVVRSDAVRDLALIKLPANYAPYPFAAVGNPFESDAFQTGDVVSVAGFPAYAGAEKPVNTDGVICGFPVMEGVRYVQSSAAVYPGNSGGPVVDRDGKVVGIVNGKYTNLSGACATFATAISELEVLARGIGELEALVKNSGWGGSGQQQVTGAHTGARAPDFTLTGVDGKPYAMSKYSGKKVLLVFPGKDDEENLRLIRCISQIYDVWPRAQLEVVAVVSTGNTATGYQPVHDVKFTALNDDNAKVYSVYDPDGSLALYFIDRFGDIKIRRVGGFSGCGREIDSLLRLY